MPNSLAGAISPYLRSHADNPVAWQQWGAEPFAEAVRRDVPVFVSIGYSTCHWCHVMARESFSDLAIAEYLNANFVAIKVDREEHPEVDSGYLAAASAFTRNLGWPLNVFVTPAGRAFFAGTYWPPDAMAGHPSFRQVLEGVANAWTERRAEVEESSSAVAEAIIAQGERSGGELPDRDALAAVVELLARNEDAQFGGFGTAPKFPVVPVLNFLLEQPGATGQALGDRTLTAIAGSGLRDPVEGGFFRYATRRDWTEPHYERMLYDNAQLLRAYALLALRVPERAKLAIEVSAGIADYLLTVLRLPGGAFASAQNSESTVDGYLTEGDYYSLSAEERERQEAPALDDKVLTGWNGLAIGALAFAGFHLDRADWVAAARTAADSILSTQMKAHGELLRATVGGKPSAARATLEDYGLLASGLLHLGQATGEVRWAIEARRLVDACLRGGAADTAGSGFAVPGGGDPVLAQQGLTLATDSSEGAYPSGLSAMASAAYHLYLLTADAHYRESATRAMESLAPLAVQQPMGFGAALAVMDALASPVSQLVVVTARADASRQLDGPLVTAARARVESGSVTAIVSEEQAHEFAASGFELFDGRKTLNGVPTAYVCRDFTCRLPTTDPAALTGA
jgi:uncharacterized protein YyaL (SSP411 family)